MGNLSDRAPSGPEAIERDLPWGGVVRGYRWGKGPDTGILLHEPGVDLDAWTTLPVKIRRRLESETVAVDLPGLGLSFPGGG